MAQMDFRFTIALYLQRRARVLRLSRSTLLRILGGAIAILYRTYTLFVLGVDIPTTTKLGRITIHHGVGLVIHDRAVIGDNVVLRQSTTIGAKTGSDAAPRLGNRVDVGSNCVILGAVTIGDDAIIGAGSVVIRDVPAGAIVAGNPARVIHDSRT